jgi:hypothetical protein
VEKIERTKYMRLKSGEEVIDRYTSHFKASVAKHLPVALAQIESLGRKFFIEEVNFREPIGETNCIPTGPSDQVIYAKRPKRFGLTRFVKNRTTEPCSSVVVILKTADGQPGVYVLITAFIGRKPEPEPWDQRNFSHQSDRAEAERLSREFWASHALLWGSEEIIPGTETNECLW